MSKMATKAVDNVFYKARIEAATCNDRLSSREGAAEQIGIDRTRLARIELGSLNPYPEEVLLMSDAYNTPEIKPYYCSEYCPLGCNNPKVVMQDLDRISLQALSSFRKIAGAKEILLDITEDGIISEDEKEELNELLSVLDEVTSISQKLKLWAEKNVK